MLPWTESYEADEPDLPEPRHWMSVLSSSSRFCEHNDGYIEIINDTSEDENEYGGLIASMKEQKKKLDEKRAKNKRKSDDFQIKTFAKISPPVLPNAPINPVIPATLSRRKKGRHHPGGWHGRTTMESNAAEKLMSLIDPEVGDLTPAIINFIIGARQTTLRLITEGHESTVEESLKRIVVNLDDSPYSFGIHHNRVLLLGKKAIENPSMEKASPAPDAVSREMLEFVLELVDKSLTASCGQEVPTNEHREQVQGEIEGLMDVEMS